MTLQELINAVKTNQHVSFDQSMQVIEQYYHFTPVAFNNGTAGAILHNKAGENSGSCRIFAFAAIHALTEQQTLQLFGDFYHQDVIAHPSGNDHANIRTFIKYGWQGISFAEKDALRLRKNHD
jgi:hypothetical protein